MAEFQWNLRNRSRRVEKQQADGHNAAPLQVTEEISDMKTCSKAEMKCTFKSYLWFAAALLRLHHVSEQVKCFPLSEVICSDGWSMFDSRNA